MKTRRQKKDEPSKLIEIRPYQPETDRAFVYGSWLHSQLKSKVFSEVPESLYLEHYETLISDCLKNPKTSCRLACLKDDRDVLLGFVVDDETFLHWIFIKEAWRNLGIAKMLLKPSYPHCSHMTKIASEIRDLKKLSIQYNPFNFLKGKS